MSPIPGSSLVDLSSWLATWLTILDLLSDKCIFIFNAILQAVILSHSSVHGVECSAHCREIRDTYESSCAICLYTFIFLSSSGYIDHCHKPDHVVRVLHCQELQHGAPLSGEQFKGCPVSLFWFLKSWSKKTCIWRILLYSHLQVEFFPTVSSKRDSVSYLWLVLLLMSVFASLSLLYFFHSLSWLVGGADESHTHGFHEDCQSFRGETQRTQH